MDLLRTYFTATGTCPPSRMRDAVRWGAAGVTVLYAAGLFYRCGGAKYIMPSTVYNKVVETVETVKSKTQPIVDKERYGLAVKHLTKTYALVSAGFATAALGTCLFFKVPEIPIGVPIVVSTSTAAVLLFGSQYMIVPARILTYFTMAFSVGVAFGPMNWIAYDTMGPLLVVVGSTTIGFSVPLLLTRGAISYFLSSQLLSSSLAIVLTCLNTIATKGTLVQQGRGRSNDDVNVMLTVQMLSNLILGALHTVPTIFVFLNKSNSIDYLKNEQDYVRQAAIIFGATAYGTWKMFQQLCRSVLKRIGREKGALSKEEQSALNKSGLASVNMMSNIGASVLSFAMYVRFVSYIQSAALHPNADPDAVMKLFEGIRKVFARLSPLNMA